MAPLDKLAGCYDRYRAQIQHEDSLLNQRVTWIVTSQVFLLGDYVFLTNSPTFFALATHAGGLPPLPGAEPAADMSAFIAYISLLRHVFQVIGICSSIATFVSSVAAVLTVGRLVRIYGRHLLALERSAQPADRRGSVPHLSKQQVAAAVRRIHEREGLPPLVTRRTYRVMGLTASVFFGVVFGCAWLVLIGPLQHLSNVSTVVLVLLSIALVGLLLYKLSDWTAEKVPLPLEEPDEA